MSVTSWPDGFVALLVGIISGLVYFLRKGYHARRQFSRLLEEGMPMPPWSPIFGHLLSFHSVLMTLPKDAQRTNIFSVLHKSFAKSDYAFYVDTWPFDIPFLVVNSASMASQATSQQLDLPKPYGLYEYLEPFAGGDNLFTMNGSEWKRSRALFNPGFSTSYIQDQVPQIVRETAVYVEILREHARKGDMFSMDDTTLWFTMDIIGAVSMNSRLNSQRSYNPLASAMRSQVNWHCSSEELNPFVRLNPLRPIMYWLNGRKMNNYISKELDKRFADLRTRGKNSTSRSIMDLVLKDYITEHPTAEMIDEVFRKWAVIQIRLFLFAGHDSTSSTICYCYYLLSKNPEALEKIRTEHNRVFGTDLTKTENVLLENPSLINQLPYTLAVMKEALRLFPPAAGIRQGLPGVFLEDSNGNKYPTEGTGVLIMHPVIQRHPQYWKDPDSFIPERWLVGPGHPLYPMKGAWRPFEFGPRNCQGQALVILDVSVTLLMTMRKFDITPAYDEWDALHPTKGLKTVDGERAYQISSGAAHPADGFPCRVLLRT